MKKIYKVLVAIIIFVILVVSITFILIRVVNNQDIKEEKESFESNRIKNTTLTYYNDPIKYESKNEKIKGKIDKINPNGALISITNNYYFSENSGKYLGKNSLDEYNLLNIYLTEDTHILNYIDSSEVKFEDIAISDILIYEGNIEYINSNERRISDGNIFILKNTDLQKLTMEQYKDVSEFKDIKIVYEYETSDLQNVKFLYGKLNVKTYKGEQFVTFVKMQISDDTIVENGNTNDTADIILKNNFETTTQNKSSDGDRENNIHEIKKISYK